MKHWTYGALFITAAFALMIVFSANAQAQTYTQYRIQLNGDRSATWTITQVSGINGTVDTWAGFQNKVIALVNAAAIQTERAMSVDGNSLQMSTSIASGNSKNTDYAFTWLNFSMSKNGQLIAGDVFGVNGFFNQLYDDGALQINYPANYTLESVTPTPDQKDLSTQTLQWLGTQFFVAEKPHMVLGAQKATAANSLQLPLYMLASVSTVVAIAAVAAGWVFFMNQRKKTAQDAAPTTLAFPETEEEKVLRVLRSSGGSAYQSAITEQCRFSKAKTSQLLTALEREGKVRRIKKGRDKIVNITEQARVKNNAGP